MLWNLRHFWLLQTCICVIEVQTANLQTCVSDSFLVQIPPFWDRLHFRDLLCVWGFHVKWTKIKNVKHSHPSTTGFAASSPGSPRSPGRWDRNFLKETLLKTIWAALAALYLPWGLYWFMVMDSKPSRPNQTIPDLWTYLTYLSDLPTYLTFLTYLTYPL